MKNDAQKNYRYQRWFRKSVIPVQFCTLSGEEFPCKIELYAPRAKNGGRKFELQSLCTDCTHVSYVRTRRSWKIDGIFKFHSFFHNRFGRLSGRLLGKYVHVENNAYVAEKIEISTRFFSGYFQNWYYVAQSLPLIDSELNELLTRNPDKGFISSDKGDFGVVHYRRGDLSNFRTSMGLLDDSYFLNAIKVALADLNPMTRLIILTDDKNAGVRAFSDITEEVFGPADIEEWEALKVMSKAQFVITSNSTFSWWGALLCSQNGGQVYLPSPWFLNWTPDPGDAFHFPDSKVIPSKFF